MSDDTKVFRAEDFAVAFLATGGEPLSKAGEALARTYMTEAAAAANARIAPLVAALERLEEASEVVLTVDEDDLGAARKAVAVFMLTGRDVLAEYRKLKGGAR